MIRGMGWLYVRSRRQEPKHMKPIPALPYSVIGFKPFRLPGEKRAWAKADERARKMLEAADAATERRLALEDLMSRPKWKEER